MSTPKPSIVFCHGLWADGSCFSKVIPVLQADGHEVIAVQYGLNNYADDVATVKRTLGRVGSPAILVGHSYGGATITGAGTDERVAALVYIAAVVPDVRETVQSQLVKYPTEIFSQIEVNRCFFPGLTFTPGFKFNRFRKQFPHVLDAVNRLTLFLFLFNDFLHNT